MDTIKIYDENGHTIDITDTDNLGLAEVIIIPTRAHLSEVREVFGINEVVIDGLKCGINYWDYRNECWSQWDVGQIKLLNKICNEL